MDRGRASRYPSPVPRYERERTVEAARSIIDGGGWCVVEACVDVPSQQWEVCALVFDLVPESVADLVQEEIEFEPGLDVRLTGCDRRTLRPEPGLGAALCYLADTPRLLAVSARVG
jgi:hypothetical protein